jgi:hypothetical protein
MPTVSDYLQQVSGGNVAVLGATWVRLTNNVTAATFVSTAASVGTSGQFTVNNVPAGSYALATGPTNTGPWTTQDSNYIVGDQTLQFNVKDYGAKGDNSTNDATAINAAITAAAGASGAVVYFPPGTYLCGATITISGDDIILRGSGWNSIIRAANGLNADLVTTPVGLGNVRNYIGIENLSFDGNRSNQSGTSSAIRFYGCRYSYIDRCFIQNALTQAIMMDSDPANIGYQDVITRNVTDTSGGAIYENGTEGCFFAWNVFKWCDTQHMLRCEKGAHKIVGNIFGGGGTTTEAAVWLRNNLCSQVIANRFDSSRRVCIQLDAGNNIVENNECKDASASGNNLAPAISTGGSVQNCIIRGNRVYAFSSVNYSYAYQENGSNNIIEGNQFQAGVSGTVNLPSATNFCRNNVGFNPQGVAAISPSGSPFTYTNNDGVDEYVTIDGGTVTTVAKNSITLYSFGGAAARCGVWLAPGEALTVTYTGAPTMNKDRK